MVAPWQLGREECKEGRQDGGGGRNDLEEVIIAILLWSVILCWSQHWHFDDDELWWSDHWDSDLLRGLMIIKLRRWSLVFTNHCVTINMLGIWILMFMEIMRQCSCEGWSFEGWSFEGWSFEGWSFEGWSIERWSLLTRKPSHQAPRKPWSPSLRPSLGRRQRFS